MLYPNILPFSIFYVHLSWQFLHFGSSGWKFWILEDPFEKDPAFWYPQILSYQNLPLCLPILKISSVNLEWKKSFNFRFLILILIFNFQQYLFGEDPPLWYLQTLSKFTFFSCIYPKNITYLPWVVKIFDFWRTRLRRTPILVFPNFVML